MCNCARLLEKFIINWVTLLVIINIFWDALIVARTSKNIYSCIYHPKGTLHSWKIFYLSFSKKLRQWIIQKSVRGEGRPINNSTGRRNASWEHPFISSLPTRKFITARVFRSWYLTLQDVQSKLLIQIRLYARIRTLEQMCSW